MVGGLWSTSPARPITGARIPVVSERISYHEDVTELKQGYKILSSASFAMDKRKGRTQSLKCGPSDLTLADE
jgi:hypothetical protein